MEKETTHCRIFRDSENNTVALQEIFNLVSYHPWHDGHNPNFDEFSRLILDVKDQHIKGINYCTNRLRSILSGTEEYVICVIPTHAVGTAPSGIRTIAKKLCSHPVIDGTDIISRVFEIPKKTVGGSRDMQSEIKSLAVTNESVVRGRQVLLLDDVTTTGTSLKAGKYLIEQAGAEIVVLLALARTQR
ncbi:MAG: phosphoribosyltransferase family protein [Euryarchaeota archaeon]|nr:phosphoribosyltransferase family protein [Euryarchaeota archaeon]MEA1998743.1 phosphoribosyltransferase family protein [Euryarchaeota archaeon]